MRFVVDRRTWFRGKGSDESRLLRNDGCRCCFGFVCSQLGIADNALIDTDEVGVLIRKGVPQAKQLTDPASPVWEFPWIRDGYEINDDESETEESRESRLTELFAANGHELVFEN